MNSSEYAAENAWTSIGRPGADVTRGLVTYKCSKYFPFFSPHLVYNLKLLQKCDRWSLPSLFMIQPAMDVLPPPDYPPAHPSEHPHIPTRIPRATLEILQALCIRGDVQKFREILDSPLSSSGRIDICDFCGTMIEVIKRNDARICRIEGRSSMHKFGTVPPFGRNLPRHRLPRIMIQSIRAKRITLG